MAAGFIVIGLALATRPVGDEAMRAHATERVTAYGSARTSWDGQYLVTVNWTTGSQQFTTKFVLPQAWPPWSQPGQLDLLFDPRHPETVALADPGWSYNADLRVDAAFQSVVPFTMAVLALAMFVIWPAPPSEAFNLNSIRRARRGLRRYLITPLVFCTLAVAVPVIIQEQPVLAYSPDADTVAGEFSALLVALVIWMCIRAARFARLRRRLTAAADAADNAAVVGIVAGRRLWISTKIANGPSGQIGAERNTGIRLLALRGQRHGQFLPGDRVRLYRSRYGFGPTVIIAGDGSRLLAGFARRTEERIADPLGPRYPALVRKLRRYRTSAQIVPIIVGGASIAVVTAVGVNPAWLWLPVMFDAWWLTANLVRYSTLSPILRGPYLAQDGIVHAIVKPARRWAVRCAVVIVDGPEQARIQVRLAGDRQAAWLTKGQPVAMFRTSSEGSGPAVLAVPHGHAELGMAKPFEPRPDSISDSLGRQFPELRGKLRRVVLLATIPLIAVCAGSVAITLGFGLNPAWLWGLGYVALFWLQAPAVTYVGLSRLIRRPYVAHHVVVADLGGPVGLWPFRGTIADLDVTDQPSKRLRLIGAQDVSWLSLGQEAVLLQSPKGDGGHAVLATADGHAALATARPTQPKGEGSAQPET